MPAKRTRSKARSHRITAEAIAAYRAGDWTQLHRALGLKPWETSPLDVEPGEESPWGPGSAGSESWPQAQELRRHLEGASE